jgi:hypothetical protein
MNWLYCVVRRNGGNFGNNREMPIFYNLWTEPQLFDWIEGEPEEEEQNIPFYHECYSFKRDLTTIQKMIAIKFIVAYENATDIEI